MNIAAHLTAPGPDVWRMLSILGRMFFCTTLVRGYGSQ